MPVISRPSKRTVPASGSRKPVMRLKSVLLPAPLGRMTARNSARATSKDTSSVAARPPKRLRSPRTLKSGSATKVAHDAVGHHHDDGDHQRAEYQRPVFG